jgi:hypothetical protein
MNTIKVEYVGKKPFAIDNVARSGKAWNGNGDVQEVTPSQAKILTSYSDQWQLVDTQDQGALEAPVQVTVEGANGQAETIDTDSLGIPLEKMNATQLKAYAKHKHGKDLPLNRGRRVLLDEVIALENGPALS